VPGDPHRGLIAISPSVEYLERAWDEAKYGGTSSEPYIEAVFPTVHEPELAPEGRHIALCFTQFGAYELRGRTWEEEREAYGKTVIRTLGAYCPNLGGTVEEVEVLAPGH
jgi:phytoene dehydrogenase-like protein